MANDFNKPDNSTDYSLVLGKIRDLIAAVAKMTFVGDSNVPTNALNFDNSTKNFGRENGAGSFATLGGVVPPGAMVGWGSTSIPTGWLLCDGSAISRSTYADLFGAISTTYGAGNGSTTFNIPDARQRFLLGKAASGTGSSLAGTGGAIDHTHTVPAHYHAMGTGADLNITSGGAHTHSIDHDHGSVTSGAGGAQTSSSNGAHTHFTVRDGLINAPGTSVNSTTMPYLVSDYNAGNDFSYDLIGTNAGAPDVALTSSDGAHTHTVADHTHSVDLPNFTGTSGSTSHTHSSGTFSGRIGLVTGGVDGNASMTSGSNNPPYLVVNWIIKV